MSWETDKRHFEDSGSLVDIYFEGMGDAGWRKLFCWLAPNCRVSSVYCYSPKEGESFDYIPSHIGDLVIQDGFQFSVSLLINDATLFLRFYGKDQLECDLWPKEVNSEEQLFGIISILDEIRRITGTSKYFMCPENLKSEAFNINGQFV